MAGLLYNLRFGFGHKIFIVQFGFYHLSVLFCLLFLFLQAFAFGLYVNYIMHINLDILIYSGSSSFGFCDVACRLESGQTLKFANQILIFIQKVNDGPVFFS